MYSVNRNTDFAMQKLQEKVKLEARETGIFISRDCIVTETYTGKTYKYRAYNYITGDTHYLGYKRNAIEAEKYVDLLYKIADFTFYNVSYPKKGEELIDYIFTTVFQDFGFNKRIEQIELSKHMYRTMIEQSISLSDIAVGLGKTHAYLIAAIVYHINDQGNKYNNCSQPIIISTSSKRLQKAIVKEYLPEISRMLLSHGIINKEITAIIRKGRQNYICDIRLKNYLKSLDPLKKNRNEYEILKEILESNQVDLENIVGLRNYDMQRIKVIPKHCRSCPQNKLCRYRKLIEKVKNPKYLFQVTNHNYMIADIFKRLKGRNPLLPDYKVVIYDEAHKLPDAYMTMQEVVLDKNDVLDLIKKVKPKYDNQKSAKVLNKYSNEVTKVINSIFQDIIFDVAHFQDEELFKYPIKNIVKLRQELYQLRNLILHIIILIPDSKKREQIELEKLGDCIDIMMHDDSIIWIENIKQSKQFIICAIPKKINEMLGQDLFSNNIATLLTSGTLSVNGDFSYIKNVLGINKKKQVREIHKFSPFNYYQNTLLYLAKDLTYPDKDNDEYIEKTTERIEMLCSASYGHALVLLTSYEVMSKIYRLLKKRQINYPLFIISKDNSSAINEYRKSRNGVLLACGSMWEGVNFIGDILSHLIIVKLPFLIPDPITDYQKSQCSSYRKFKEEILIPKMLTKLKQGYGRAIRTETDTAVISILDVRANSNYKEVIKQALPDCKITYKIEDITRFIQDKKSPEYFL